MAKQLTPREETMLQLRVAGVKSEQVAERLRKSATAVDDELRALLHDRHPGVDPEVALELERLDTMTRAVWKGVLREESSAVARALSISDRRREVVREAESRTPSQKLDDSMQALLRSALESNKNLPTTDKVDATPTDESNKE